MTENYRKMIGRAMRYERELRRLTTQQMADRLGVDRSSIARWETGQRSITVESLIQYLDAMNIDLYDFMESVKERENV